MTKQPPHFVLGITGPAGAGKSTLAREIRERFRFNHPQQAVQIRKLAAPLREMLAAVGVEKGDGPGEVPSPCFRDAAQQLGSWFRNTVSLSFWVDIQRHALGGISEPSVVLYDDVRYWNECEMCDLVVRLTSSRPSSLAGYQLVHESEREWDRLPVAATFENNQPGDLGRIADVVERMIVDGVAAQERATA